MKNVLFLELSKVLMNDIHISSIKKKYGDRAVLCFTDTETICNDIFTKDGYVDVKQDHHHFDFIDYHETHFLHNNLKKGSFLGK